MNKEPKLKNLKSLIQKHGYNETALAKELGVHRVSVCRWVNGASLPTLTMLARISQILNEPLSEIVGE